jgi:hypothetical protein
MNINKLLVNKRVRKRHAKRREVKSMAKGKNNANAVPSIEKAVRKIAVTLAPLSESDRKSALRGARAFLKLAKKIGG